MKITEAQLIDFIKRGIAHYSHVMKVLEENNCDQSVWADMHGRVESHKEILDVIENGFNGPGPWDEVK